MTTCQIEVLLTNQPLNATLVQSKLEDDDCGAQLIFLGVTRRITGNQITTHLAYEAYQPMAENELRKIAETASETWPLRKIILHHRLGKVDVGQASVIVAATSSHRPAVMEAVPWMMDRLKQDVPIWKKESLADGSEGWIHPEP